MRARDLAVVAVLVAAPSMAGGTERSDTAEPAEAPLMIEVEPFPNWPAKGVLPRLHSTNLVLHNAGRANIDGRLNEPAWASQPGPPLFALRTAQSAPDARIVALSTPDGLAFGLSGQPSEPGWSTTITVDPSGTRSHWLKLELDDDGVTWTRCEPDPLISEGAGTPRWPPSAMPCEVVELTKSVARLGPDGWEMLFAWADLPAPALSTVQIAFATQGPDGQGGTWQVNRATTTVPPAGRVLELANRPSGRLRYDLENGGATLEVTARTKEQAGEWTWIALQNGIEAARGTVDVPSEGGAGGTGKAFLKDLPFEGSVLATQDLDTPLSPAAVVFLPYEYFQANPLNPIHEGTVTVAVHLLDAYPNVPVIVRDEQGRVLGQADAMLPAGRSDLIIAIPRHWPDSLTLQVGTLLDADTRLMRRGFTARRLETP